MAGLRRRCRIIWLGHGLVQSMAAPVAFAKLPKNKSTDCFFDCSSPLKRGGRKKGGAHPCRGFLRQNLPEFGMGISGFDFLNVRGSSEWAVSICVPGVSPRPLTPGCKARLSFSRLPRRHPPHRSRALSSLLFPSLPEDSQSPTHF